MNTESILKRILNCLLKISHYFLLFKPSSFLKAAPDRDKRNIFMQKSGPGTEAQSESISSRDRNLIQVILCFIPRLADLKVFTTSDTHRHHWVMFARVLGSGKSWCGIFCPLGMDSEYTVESPCIWSRQAGFIL